MDTIPITLNFSNYSRVFKIGFAKYTGENKTDVAAGFQSMELDNGKVMLNFVVGNGEDAIPLQRELLAADAEMPMRLFKNLATITEAWDRALPHASFEWKESVLMRTLPALSKLDYNLMPMLDQEIVFEMNAQLEDDQELEVLAFDWSETPRYQKDGFVVTDEVLVLLPLEMGSDGLRHGVRTFPMLIVGNNIAFNQHFPVEIFKRPRIEMNDPEYVPTRTGKVSWYSTGIATITEHPTYGDKEIYGKGIGASGVEYELSLAGILPITM